MNVKLDWYKIGNCKLKCQRCKYYWEEERPGPTQCPECGWLYVDWLNYKEVLTGIYKQSPKETSYVP